MDARDFGLTNDPYAEAEEDVRPYRALSPAERYSRLLDLMRFMDRIWGAIEPAKRAGYERAQDELDDPGRWWERVPSR
ncbi:MAG: hypothetical protein HY922_07235 [Elusimicrobia bacterium]|nr:hypothetical protein [Elusimicrobiota bacterium]